MMHLKFRNVNDAFRGLVHGIHIGEIPTVRRPSRNGQVIQVDEPVTITYSHPRERVLFNAARDASPYFHLYESLWMLAGRNDVAPLAYYAKQMAEYSDDGKTLNGAYGYRWRKASGGLEMEQSEESVDQLDIIVNHLKADPNSRRAVLQMWNVEDDLLKIGQKCKQCGGSGIYRGPYTPDDPNSEHVEEMCEDCDGSGGKGSKDVCCNLSVMFSLREERVGVDEDYDELRPYLDMTVTNRSNDMVWGMLGTNYVHFSFLQEYMAARLGVGVGRYHHFSNNLHVYDEPDKAGIPKWTPDEWLADQSGDYKCGFTHWVPLVRDPAVFDGEVREFVQFHGVEESRCNGPAQRWDEPFLEQVAQPALDVFHFHKLGDRELALMTAESIKADDWRVACTNWLQRRMK